MDFGSIIAGAIGGVAKSAGEIADQNIKSQAEEDRFRRQAAWDVQKANAAMDRKLQLEEQMAQRTEKRYTDAADMAETRGREIGMDKAATSMQAARANLPNEGDYANVPVSRTDIESLPPAARKIYEEQGLIPKTTESGIIANQMQAAREGGAPKALRDDLRKNYQDAAKAESDVRKVAFDQQKLDAQERIAMEREDRKDARQQNQIEALAERTQKAIEGKATKDDIRKTLAMIDSERKAITSEATDARRALTQELQGVYDPEEKKAIRANYEKTFANIEARRRQQDKQFDSVRAALESASDKPAPRSESSVGRDTTASDINSNIAANNRSIAELRKQPLMKGETQASRDEQISMIERENERMSKGGSANPGAASSPAPAASKPAAQAKTMPQGSRFIGTSKGRPVYELPDGTRVISTS